MYSTTESLPLEKRNKDKKPPTIFVVVQRTPEDYNIKGIFDSLQKAVEAQIEKNINNCHIEELPLNCNFQFNNLNYNAIIDGALNVFDLHGNQI
jgi:hypothetical protein